MKKVELLGLPTIVWQMQPCGESPPGANSTFKQPPVDLDLGTVDSIVEMPDWVTQFALAQRVAIKVRVDGQVIRTLSEERFNTTCYAVHRTEAVANRAIACGRVLVPVNRALEGVLWISTAPQST